MEQPEHPDWIIEKVVFRNERGVGIYLTIACKITNVTTIFSDFVGANGVLFWYTFIGMFYLEIIVLLSYGTVLIHYCKINCNLLFWLVILG